MQIIPIRESPTKVGRVLSCFVKKVLFSSHSHNFIFIKSVRRITLTHRNRCSRFQIDRPTDRSTVRAKTSIACCRRSSDPSRATPSIPRLLKGRRRGGSDRGRAKLKRGVTLFVAVLCPCVWVALQQARCSSSRHPNTISCAHRRPSLGGDRERASGRPIDQAVLMILSRRKPRCWSRWSSFVFFNARAW